MSEKQSSGTTETHWLETPRPAFTPLDADVSTDLCVIGAGIAGLSTAYLAAALTSIASSIGTPWNAVGIAPATARDSTPMANA